MKYTLMQTTAISDTPPPAPSTKKSQQDRELLRQYLVTTLRPQSTFEASSSKEWAEDLAEAIPLVGSLLGRRKGVVAGTTVSDPQTENIKREALFQQHRLLTLSATYVDSAPWITYLTATKHSQFMDCYGLTTSAFADFGDKKVVDETALLADELEVKSSALMDSETSNSVRELIRFQGRQEQVKSVSSILDEIISSPHRALIHSQLTNGNVEIVRHDPTLKALPNGSKYGPRVMIYIVGGSLAAVAGYLSFTAASNLTGHGWLTATVLGAVLVLTAFIGIVRGLVDSGTAKIQREALKAEGERYGYERFLEDQRIQSILNTVNYLAESFRSTVTALLDERHIPINLDDFEGMLSELATYQTWGLETESRYTKT